MFRVATFLLAAMAHASEDPYGCSSSLCSSPDGQGGTDCYAGPYSEPCSCSSGGAYPVGLMPYNDQMYTQYTCCTAESGLPTQGSSCAYPGVSASAAAVEVVVDDEFEQIVAHVDQFERAQLAERLGQRGQRGKSSSPPL